MHFLSLSHSSRYLVALSGGADSVALLLCMLRGGYEIEAAHCNFQLRGEESERDERFVRELCEQRGVRLHTVRFDTRAAAAERHESIEMAARRLRYEWFDALRRERKLDYVAVAHHRDDNVETFLLNLLRGAGIHGLTGMRSERGGVVRPLLETTHAEILQFLESEGQPFVTDSTNADTLFRRNKIRHELLPLLRTINPSADATIADTVRRLSDAERFFDYAVSALADQVMRRCGDVLKIDLAALQRTPAPNLLLFELLSSYGFNGAETEEILTAKTGGCWQSATHIATRTNTAIEVAPMPQPVAETALPQEGTLALPGGRTIAVERMPRERLGGIPRDPNIAVLDADALDTYIYIRSVRTGDRFSPFGMRGTQLVSDYLTNRRRSRIDKLRALAVCDSAGILWLAGERPDNRAAVKPETKNIVKLVLSCVEKP